MDKFVEDTNIQRPKISPDGRTETLTADTARQAPKGKRVMVVLVAGLVLVALAWIVVHWAVPAVP